MESRSDQSDLPVPESTLLRNMLAQANDDEGQIRKTAP